MIIKNRNQHLNSSSVIYIWIFSLDYRQTIVDSLFSIVALGFL